MAFGNDIVGGTTLLRPAIQSPNYIPGVQGWTINRDGTSEFAGGTFRGAVVVIDPVTGNVLATIGANGNGTFQYVYATNDVIIGAVSVLQAITHTAQGIVGYYNTTGTVPNIPAVSSGYADILWCSCNLTAGRMYRAATVGGLIDNTNISNFEDYYSRLILAQTGGLSGQVGAGYSGTYPGTNAGIMCEGVFAPTVSGPATVKLQMANNSASTAYPISTSNGMAIYVEDIGLQIPSQGGSGTPSGGQNFNNIYTATASQVYNAPQGNSEGDPNNLYIGQLSGRPYTHENSIWCFNGAQIRSDLSGATNISGQLWMYCTNSSQSTGSAYLSFVTNSVPPATGPVPGTDGHNHTGLWPVPGWASVGITSYISSSIISGGANAVLVQDSGLTGAASWYGAGNATYAPYLQISYTK